MTKKKSIIINSDTINIKLSLIIDKFFNSNASMDVVIMGGYIGREIVDENFFHHVDSELIKLHGAQGTELNPDRFIGTNYRELVYSLFITITDTIHNHLDIDETMLEAKFISKTPQGYEYEIVTETITI